MSKKEQKYIGEGEEEPSMSFLDHLEALRWHLIRSLIAILVFAVLGFVFKSILFDIIILGPKKEDFFTYQMLCKLSVYLHGLMPDLINEDTICLGQGMPELQNFKMSGQFMTHMVVSIIAGFVCAFPYILWEVWRFVAPGLHSHERKYAGGIVIYCSLLFFCGVLFGYYVIAPLSVNFFLFYKVSESVQNIPNLSDYISMVTQIVVGCALLFELPVIIYFLSKLGIVTPSFLKKYRKHAVVVCLILSAIITPPDFISQLIVCVPLMLLYELGIYIAKIVTKKQEAAFK